MKTYFIRFAFIAIIVLTACGLRAESPAPDYDKVRSGTLFLASEHTTIDAILLHSSFSMHIAGVIADVQMSQDFENSSNEWVEGIYAFPLPENASIRTMNIRIGERLIEGRILEKQIARDEYKKAKKQGQVAGLIRQERSNLFTTRIANIAPGEKVTVELDYFQTLEIQDEVFSLRLPTTLTPRYIPGDKMSALHFSENPLETIQFIEDAVAISPPQKYLGEGELPTVSLNIVLESRWPLAEIDSQSHEIEVIELEDRYLISLNQIETAMDRDFTLNWKGFSEQEPLPSLYIQKQNSETFGLVVVNPPPSASVETINRELIFVVDTSGSMAGNSIRAAKAALISALDKLRPGDKFNLIQFNSSAEQLYGEPQFANPEQLANAKRYIRRLNADGGTEMQAAIELSLAGQNEEFLRQVVFITDGSVGNEHELLSLLHQQLEHARLFTVGIGTAPNSFFMRKAAEFGRGNFRFIANTSSVEDEINRLFKQLQYPALTSIGLKSDTGFVEHYPEPVPDLYAGQPVVLAAKIPDQTNELILEGEINGESWLKKLDVKSASSDSTGISSVWARQKIDQLMNQQWIYSDDQLHRSEIIRLSQSFSVLSPYTSFLAMETDSSSMHTGKLKTERIKNLMPGGSTMTAVQFPQGATGSYAWILAAMVLSLLGALLYSLLNPERPTV